MPADRSGRKISEVLLHASSVSINGRALVFLGHSNSGKSTISRLLSREYPIIADDKVRLRKNKTGEWLAGNADSKNILQIDDGVPRVSSQEFPLSAFIRIYKSDATACRPISPRTTCGYLLDAVFEVAGQRSEEDPAIVKKWFELLADVSKKIDGWHLTFKNDTSIVSLVKRVFTQVS